MLKLKDILISVICWLIIVLFIISAIFWLPAYLRWRSIKKSSDTFNNYRVRNNERSRNAEQQWQENAKEIDKKRSDQ